MGEVDLRIEGRVGRITLTRPGALNALSHGMVCDIGAVLADWRTDETVDLVLINAEGPRAFCAGGDIVAVYEAGRRGEFAGGNRFWADEYRMNAAIARFPKPFVALINGFCMGGGVGLAGHASHRIVGETVQMAMPECLIGLIPDVGGTHLLSRAPGHLGEFLGLTGQRMGPGDALYAGFADIYVPEARWPELTAALLASGDVSVIAGVAETAPEAPLAALREGIDDAFEAEDIQVLAARLETTDWGHGVLKLLRRQCPLSMACTLELVRAARRDPGIEKALTREHRFTARAARDGEFLEGVRAALIDKDRAPIWRDDMDSLRPGEVAAMLAPLGPDEALQMPTGA